MNVSLIITTYNWPEALEIVLHSVLSQSIFPNEIIIADDGSSEKTRMLVENFILQTEIPVVHSWQEDRGFRLSRSRNLAITKSSYEYVIFTDGDLILHKDFIKDHIVNSHKGIYLQGSRVFINEEYSKSLLRNKNLDIPSFFSRGLKNKLNAIRSPILTKIFFNKTNQKIKRIRSCNFSMFKEDIIRVNGFNEEFTTWGQEDSEFVQRLFFSGIKRRNIKFSALQYHIHHKQGKSQENNLQLLRNTVEKQLTWCEHGIDKHLTNNV